MRKTVLLGIGSAFLRLSVLCFVFWFTLALPWNTALISPVLAVSILGLYAFYTRRFSQRDDWFSRWKVNTQFFSGENLNKIIERIDSKFSGLEITRRTADEVTFKGKIEVPGESLYSFLSGYGDFDRSFEIKISKHKNGFIVRTSVGPSRWNLVGPELSGRQNGYICLEDIEKQLSYCKS